MHSVWHSLIWSVKTVYNVQIHFQNLQLIPVCHFFYKQNQRGCDRFNDIFCYELKAWPLIGQAQWFEKGFHYVD